MKNLIAAALLVVSSIALAQTTEVIKTKVTEVKKTACPMVNGKEDCTVPEVKTKVLEVKKKITQ